VEEDAGVTICKPLAALELGFHTRMLRTLQESVWAVKFEDIHNVDAGLESIHRRLVALSDRLNLLQFSRFLELKTRIEDRHDEAAVFKGQLRGELFAEVGDPEEAMRRLPRRVEERAGVLRGWQRQDWEEVRLIAWKAVEGDRRLEAWWEIGLRLADMILRMGTPETPATWTEADVKGLLAAVAKLPGEEKAWVEDILPSTPPTEPRFPFLLNAAYKDLRGFITEFEKRRAEYPPIREEVEAAEEFTHSNDFRRCTWRGKPFKFSKTQARMFEALYRDWERGGGGLSADALFDAAGSDRTERRVGRVFQQTRQHKTGPHPAVDAGLIENDEAGVWWLNLKKARKKP
jgi:hypothetical protein